MDLRNFGLCAPIRIGTDMSTTTTAPETPLPRIGYTVEEATQILSCSEHMLRAGVAEGRYPHLAWPRGIRFTLEHLETIAAMHEEAARTTSADDAAASEPVADAPDDRPVFRYDPNMPGTPRSQRAQFNAELAAGKHRPAHISSAGHSNQKAQEAQ